MSQFLSPALALLLSGLLTGVLRGRTREILLLVTPLVSLALSSQVPDGVVTTVHFLGKTLRPVEGEAIRRLFACFFCLTLFVALLFGMRQARWYELSAAQFYAAGAIGVCFAGDMISLFLYWELMAIFSTVLIWCGGTEKARAAGIRYAVLHLLGGVLLKAGIEGVMVRTASIDIVQLSLDSFGAWAVLIGVLVNVAAWPLSVWVVDAYPRSSPTGSVFLSAFTTKTGVLALLLLFVGADPLVTIGLVMVFHGLVYSALVSQMRRFLAHSLVTQLGFMVVALGVGTVPAMEGCVALVLSLVPAQALLFMCAAAVLQLTGRDRFRDLGGLARHMPIAAGAALIATALLSAVPFTGTFYGHAALAAEAEKSYGAVTLCLLAAGFIGAAVQAMVFCWRVFFGERRALVSGRLPANMRLGLLAGSLLCVVSTALPVLVPGVRLDTSDGYYLWLWLALVLIALLLWLLFRRRALPRRDEEPPDVDLLWRVFLPRFAVAVAAACGHLTAHLETALARLRRQAGETSRRWFAADGIVGRSWEIGSTALWVILLLGAYILLYYL